MSQCIVPGCGVRMGPCGMANGIQSFDIPDDPQVHMMYREVFGPRLELFIGKSTRICSRHFSPDDYNLMWGLRKGARPYTDVTMVPKDRIRPDQPMEDYNDIRVNENADVPVVFRSKRSTRVEPRLSRVGKKVPNGTVRRFTNPLPPSMREDESNAAKDVRLPVLKYSRSSANTLVASSNVHQASLERSGTLSGSEEDNLKESSRDGTPAAGDGAFESRGSPEDESSFRAHPHDCVLPACEDHEYRSSDGQKEQPVHEVIMGEDYPFDTADAVCSSRFSPLPKSEPAEDSVQESSNTDVPTTDPKSPKNPRSTSTVAQNSVCGVEPKTVISKIKHSEARTVGRFQRDDFQERRNIHSDREDVRKPKRKCIVPCCNVRMGIAGMVNGIMCFDVPEDPLTQEIYRDILGPSVSFKNGARICSTHFNPADYSLKGGLRRGARPKLDLDPLIPSSYRERKGASQRKRALASSFELDQISCLSSKSSRNSDALLASEKSRFCLVPTDLPNATADCVCVIQGCGNRYINREDHRKLFFFRCPAKPSANDAEDQHVLYHKWLRASGREETEDFASDDVVCSLHFEPYEFVLRSDKPFRGLMACPSRLLPKKMPPYATEMAARLAFLEDQQEIVCRRRWNELISLVHIPPPGEFCGGWSMFEQDDTCAVFGHVRERIMDGKSRSAADCIRFDRDMTVSLSTGSKSIPIEDYSPLLENGKAITVEQVRSLFLVNFARYDSTDLPAATW